MPPLQPLGFSDPGSTNILGNNGYNQQNTGLQPIMNTGFTQGVPPIYFYDQGYILLAQLDKPQADKQVIDTSIACLSIEDWNLPGAGVGSFSNYILQNKSDYRESIAQQAKMLPKDYVSLWKMVQDKKVDGYKEFYKKLQELIDKANQENKPLIVLVGDYHRSKGLSGIFGEGAYIGSNSKPKFIPGFLASLTGITDIAFENIQSNPDQKIIMTDKLKEKLIKLIRQVKKMKFKNKSDRDEKIWDLINADQGLKQFFNGDADSIVSKYLQANNKDEEKFYWDIVKIFVMIYVNINNDVEEKLLSTIKYAKKKGITVNGLYITGKDMDENYFASNKMFGLKDYLTMLEVHMANNLERIICNTQRNGKNPIIFAFVGRYHIKKDGIPLYVRTKDAIVTSVFLDGGIEDQCNHLDLLLKQKGVGKQTFWVDTQGFKEADFIFHIPSFEGSEKGECKSPLMLNQ